MKKFLMSLVMVFSMTFVTVTLVVLAIYKAGYHPVTEQNMEVQRGNWVSDELPLRYRDNLVVVFANLNHGMGLGTVWYEVPNATPKPESVDAVKGRLDAFVKQVAPRDPDVVLLQEVDFGSEATGMLDQAEYLASRLNFPYVSRVPDQKSPYPLYPDVFGRVMAGSIDSGYAVLSRYPLVSSVQKPLTKSTRRPWALDSFGPISYVHEARISMDDGRLLKLLHVRLDQWDAAARHDQAADAAKWIDDRDYADAVVFVSAYAEPPKRPKNAEEAKAFGEIDYTVDILRFRRHLKDLVNDLDHKEHPELYRNVLDAEGKPVAFFDRAMVGPQVRSPKLETLKEGAGYSDHLPLVLDFQIPGTR
jgi:endonuclease/exonuclease/phosphatase family metal-dependent hydrolase